jgi:hypothetical protein
MLCALLVFLTLALASGRVQAQTSALAREAAEFVVQRFGAQAARGGTAALARQIETYAARHGGEFIQAVRSVGPRAFTLVEEAGIHGSKAARILARHGEKGAAWVVSRPQAMSLVARHGESAAAVLVKHAGGVTEPVIERFGGTAVRALESVGPQSGRRLAMMMADGELARIGRTEEFLSVVGKFGDKAMRFIWEHKGALAVGTVAAAFLADPEPFINGTKDLAKIAADATVKPLAEGIGHAATEGAREIGRSANGTLVLIVLGGGVLAMAGFWLFKRRPGASPSMLQPAAPAAIPLPAGQHQCNGRPVRVRPIDNRPQA